MSPLAEVVDRELRERGTRERAEKEKSYLKSEIDHYGVSVPDTRSVVRAALREADLGHDDAIDLAGQLWTQPREKPVYERRLAATMVLIHMQDHLGAGDADVIEGFLREAKTWALVDPLAGDLVGPLSEQDSGFDPMLERWAIDADFWIRRSALLAHLRPLRAGRGDFDRFSRFADAMLEEREFFIRKAIGWVLRDTAKKRPDLVFDWILLRAHRASGVSLREAVKPLSQSQRDAVLAER
ncbi:MULTISPECIES: DNA alkylation repair protein [unclassified Brevibacterium]|uniref:DNA alkylation repair protein n=1 Tax=unclassified Brevibacterium TaxID=2614124 RepID=UPI0010922AC3|nr:DNA alkylation repair protein [Brevibacterium sp. S22]TGD30035.1 DNA alkylation repair protein [Brevibacterium sp. S22]